MDSTNGHSEENPQKKGDGFEFRSSGKPRKIDLDDLPYEEREKIMEFMEMMGLDEPPEIYAVDIEMYITDYDIIPIEFLAEALKSAIKDDRFEDAAKLRDIIKSRDFTIEITDKNLSLKKK